MAEAEQIHEADRKMVTELEEQKRKAQEDAQLVKKQEEEVAKRQQELVAQKKRQHAVDEAIAKEKALQAQKETERLDVE